MTNLDLYSEFSPGWIPLKTSLSLLCPWASSRPSWGSLLLLWAQSPFSLSPETSTLLRPGPPCSLAASEAALTGSSYPSCLSFLTLGLFLLLFPSSSVSAPIRLQTPSLLQPHPVSSSGVSDLQCHSGSGGLKQQGWARKSSFRFRHTVSFIRGSGHITRRSPKSSEAELRNHLSV